MQEKADKAKPVKDLLHLKKIREFRGWIIVDAEHKYDKIAKIHHLLVPKRVVADLDDLTQHELFEWYEILGTITREGVYKQIMMTLPDTRSVPEHIHFHLLDSI